MSDNDSVRNWFQQWGKRVAAVDMQAAKALFHEDVVGFGTYMDWVDGLDRLAAEQWSSIWPTIEDFVFELDTLRVLYSPDRRQATAMILWNSTGISESGERYERPGRATVVLVRSSIDEPWKGIHTHLSVFPRQQKLSFGERQTT